MWCWHKMLKLPGLAIVCFLTITAGWCQPAARPATSAVAPGAAAGPFAPATPMVQRVLLYASPTTRARFAATGLDANESVRTWEVFLRKYRVPFQLVSSVDQLEMLQPGVLLLPSAVALTEREMQAVREFRSKGGGVLSTWMTGVRSETGEWRGYGFMESALDAKVVGNNEAAKDDTFLIMHGDTPAVHDLPAGLRVWMEYAKDWHPLRLVGRQAAAELMDWSRTVASGKASSTIIFDERSQPSGRSSRSVVLGYPERLWRSGDPKALEAIAHNSLMWLLRQPDVFVPNWPHPYGSALVVAVAAVDIMVDVDLLFSKMMEDAGGRATYYMLSENAAKSAKILEQVQAKGHEVAYHGDRFDGFKDQSAAVQSKRLGTMVNEMKEAGFNLAGNTGFRAPMDLYDQTTEKLLQERGMGHSLTFMGMVDTRLPYFAQADASVARRMVVLPRTQSAPEDLMDTEPEAGMKTFLAELDLIDKMAGLSVVTIPGQSLLSKEQLTQTFDYLKASRGRIWWATAAQVAEWWRERERLSARLESGVSGLQLKITVKGAAPLGRAAVVWVNLPESGGALRLVSVGGMARVPKVASVDRWRGAVVLDGFAPGEYQWNLYFDRPAASASR